MHQRHWEKVCEEQRQEIARLTRERDEYARQRNAQCEHDAEEIAKLKRERDVLRAALQQIVAEADSDDGLTAWDGADIARDALEQTQNK